MTGFPRFMGGTGESSISTTEYRLEILTQRHRTFVGASQESRKPYQPGAQPLSAGPVIEALGPADVRIVITAPGDTLIEFDSWCPLLIQLKFNSLSVLQV